jgi:hypothetical protein
MQFGVAFNEPGQFLQRLQRKVLIAAIGKIFLLKFLFKILLREGMG